MWWHWVTWCGCPAVPGDAVLASSPSLHHAYHGSLVTPSVCFWTPPCISVPVCVMCDVTTCAQADHVLQRLKLCRMSAEQESTSSFKIFYGKHLLNSTSTTRAVVRLLRAEAEFYAAVKSAAAGIGCVSMMRDLGVVLQQQGVAVNAKGLGVELTVTASKSSWTQRQEEPLQCEEVPDVSDISQPRRCGCNVSWSMATSR